MGVEQVLPGERQLQSVNRLPAQAEIEAPVGLDREARQGADMVEGAVEFDMLGGGGAGGEP